MSIKSAPSELVEALLTVDECAMTEDKLCKLIKMSPNEEEEKTLRESMDIYDELSAQEQCLIQLLKVPRL